MRITQGHLSKGLSSFNFVDRCNLQKIHNLNHPTVIFGFYTQEDFDLLKSLQNKVTIFWGGMDSKMLTPDKSIYISSNKNIRNVTCLPNVKKELEKKGIICEVIKVFGPGFKSNPVKMGTKVYSYVPNHRKDYYGINIINQLNLGDNLLIGNQSVPMNEWLSGKQYDYYSNCFIGLSLCDFAGGGTSIIELGLCGIRTVTNIIDFPNTLKWSKVEDIKNHIENEKSNIGSFNKELADMCFEYIDHKLDWLNI
jgi:hypothetical protein